MAGIWTNPSAFAPFYDTSVTIHAVRKDGAERGGVFPAMVTLNGFDAPFGEASPSAERQTVSVIIPFDAWDNSAQDGEPRIGDKLTIEDGRNFAITNVRKDEAAYYLTAREER